MYDGRIAGREVGELEAKKRSDMISWEGVGRDRYRWHRLVCRERGYRDFRQIGGRSHYCDRCR